MGRYELSEFGFVERGNIFNEDSIKSISLNIRKLNYEYETYRLAIVLFVDNRGLEAEIFFTKNELARISSKKICEKLMRYDVSEYPMIENLFSNEIFLDWCLEKLRYAIKEIRNIVLLQKGL